MQERVGQAPASPDPPEPRPARSRGLGMHQLQAWKETENTGRMQGEQETDWDEVGDGFLLGKGKLGGNSWMGWNSQRSHP